MKKLIILDLDGTLVDSLGDITTAVNHARRCAGLPPVDRNCVRRAVGDGVTNLVTRLVCRENPDVTAPEALGWFLPAYESVMLATTVPYPGIVPALRRARRDGWLLAVLSNKLTRLARSVVQGIADFRGLFEVVYGGDAFPERKPSPAGIRAIMAELGVAPGRTCMVGDSCNDVLSGKQAMCTTVGVAYGFSETDVFSTCRPDALVAEPGSLYTVIDGLFSHSKIRE